MNARILGTTVAALILLALAWLGIVRMTWREDATAVPAAGSAVGEVRVAAAASREPAATAAGTAVAPTSSAGRSAAGTAPGSAPGAPERSAAEAAAPNHDDARGAANNLGGAGRSAGAAAPTRYPADLGGLQRAIGSVVPEVRECYAAWRKLRPGLAGAMRVHLTIEPDPKAKDVAHVTRADIVGDALHQPAVAGCVQNALDELSFEPPPEGKLDVVLPLQFAGAP